MPERSSRCPLERDNGDQVEADPFQTAYFQLPDKPNVNQPKWVQVDFDLGWGAGAERAPFCPPTPFTLLAFYLLLLRSNEPAVEFLKAERR
uniref:Uncharacterized protein n=1 Tax=Anguilla anguilla TaxID=7936 RepID=A0A0E9VLG9_ANGAN